MTASVATCIRCTDGGPTKRSARTRSFTANGERDHVPFHKYVFFPMSCCSYTSLCFPTGRRRWALQPSDRHSDSDTRAELDTTHYFRHTRDAHASRLAYGLIDYLYFDRFSRSAIWCCRDTLNSRSRRTRRTANDSNSHGIPTRTQS